jgi:hypothetical protein
MWQTLPRYSVERYYGLTIKTPTHTDLRCFNDFIDTERLTDELSEAPAHAPTGYHHEQRHRGGDGVGGAGGAVPPSIMVASPGAPGFVMVPTEREQAAASGGGTFLDWVDRYLACVGRA